MSQTPTLEYNATLLSREGVNCRQLVLRIEPDGGPLDFTPGQFAVLGLFGREPRVSEADPEEAPPGPDHLIRRAYSIASSSYERRYVEFYLNLVTGGQLTPRLFGLQRGGRLFLRPKTTGLFTLDRVAPGRAVILIATGTGLAPYMSMLRTTLSLDAGRRFVLLHGARYASELGYRTELEQWARRWANLTYIPCITRPERAEPFPGPVGRIQELLGQDILRRHAGIELDPAVADVFLCGNPDMIREVELLLQARGFVPHHGKQAGNLHTEKYW